MDTAHWWSNFVQRPNALSTLALLGPSLEANQGNALTGNYDDVLDHWIGRRQELIADDRIEAFIFFFENVLPNPRVARLEFLKVVAAYHDLSTREKRNFPKPQRNDWYFLGDRFERIQPVTPVIGFYRLNYNFLCFRNSEADRGVLESLYRKAKEAAEGLESSEYHEGLGHLEYNFARLLLKDDSRDEALAPWRESSKHREAFYEILLKEGQGDGLKKAAAQQLAKNRYEFPHFFPGVDIGQCGVAEALFVALQQRYGRDFLNSCVNKPK